MDEPCVCSSAEYCCCIYSRFSRTSYYQPQVPTNYPFHSPAPAQSLDQQYTSTNDSYHAPGTALSSPSGWSAGSSNAGSPIGDVFHFGMHPAYMNSPTGFPRSFNPALVNTIAFPGAGFMGQPFADQTNSSVSQPTTNGKRPRAKAISGNPAPAKRARAPRASASSNPPVSVAAAATCGVGPSSPAVTPPNADAESRKRSDNVRKASDIYMFFRPVTSREKPAELPTPDSTHNDFQKPGLLMEKPKERDVPFLACRVCPEWKTFKNADGFVTTGRTHLTNHHRDVYEAVTTAMNVNRPDSKVPVERNLGPWSVESWLKLLIRLIAVNDEAINLVDCDEFRDFALFGRENVADDDLPHRTAMTERVIREYQKEYDALLADFKRAYGRISFTGDIWSDPNLRSFLALTGHYCTRDESGNLVIVNRLLCFRVVDGSHDGENIARHMYDVMDKAQLIPKLGCVTLDNASNNDTAMREFEDLVNSNPTSTIPFDADGNRIRCFGHIINIAAQTILKELKENPTEPLFAEGAPDAINDPDGHARVLQLVNDLTDDICSKVRSIIGACRASGQRRNDLTNTIKQGREDGSWSDMPILQLLRDIDIRWSSTYNSHDRLLILYSAIHFWLGRPSQASLVHHQLTQSQLQLLTDIQDILRPAHAAQELLSAEKTPTLSLALPAFELMLEAWMALQKVHMDLSHYIGVGMEKVIKYVTKGRKSRVYALAMIINPTIKLEWIKQHWPAADAKQAEEWMIDAMTAFITAQRRARPVPLTRATTEPQIHTAASAQASGFQKLAALSNPTRRIVSLPSIPSARSTATERTTPAISTPSTPTPTPTPAPPLTAEQRRAAEAALCEEDRQNAIRQLAGYTSEPLETAGKQFDIIQYWDRNERHKPAMFRVKLLTSVQTRGCLHRYPWKKPAGFKPVDTGTCFPRMPRVQVWVE